MTRLQILAGRVLAYLQARPAGAWVLALGALMTLAFAPFGIWPLALLSLGGLFWLVKHASNRKQAAGAALLWGLGHHLTGLYWLPRAFALDACGAWVSDGGGWCAAQAAVLGGLPALLAIALYGALGVVLVAVLTRSTPLNLHAPAFVGGWVILEMLKALTPYGFPWLMVGAAWANGPLMMQLASLGGVFILSFIILSCSVLLALGGWKRVILVCVILTGVTVFGVVRLVQAPATGEVGPVVRLVQPDIKSPHKWSASTRFAYLNETLETAFPPLDGVAPQVVVLPETAVAFFLNEQPDIAHLASRGLLADGSLVTGTTRRQWPAQGMGGLPLFYNSLAVIRPGGQVTAMYDKQLLVPFGEFIPLRGLLEQLPLPVSLRTFSQSRLDFGFGTADPRLPTTAGVAVGLICYEGIFPWHVARHSAGADWLVNVTNDNWFTGTIALYQHAALARLRAVETGLPLIRVANTGLTVAFDGYGRELGRLPVDAVAKMDIALPRPVRGGTLFSWLIGR